MKISNPFSFVWSWMVARIAEHEGLTKLKDRSAPIDAWIHYGNQRVAARDPKTKHDVEAYKVNSNVYIATRAISDAVASLPCRIVGMETVGGVEREYEDIDHEANQIIEKPNPSHSWVDVVRHQVKSYLGDGNAFMTIERSTGPNTRVEVWPRDPRTVKMTLSEGGTPDGYVIGSGTTRARSYKLHQVTHVRDVDPDNPFYGSSRINSVRVEIMMDHFANEFNKNFFQHGGALHLMFTPDHDLGDSQHEALLEALSSDLGGVDKAFKIFVNKYAGKLTNADLKHKDIAFLELLKHNREKIFGVYGLPPFRGGVMEYANYANALAQDVDFWNNTIAPILMVLEATFNMQLIWPIYGTEYRMKFDTSDVPALKGDPLDRAEEYCKYKKNGIMTADEVREKLDMAPLPKEEKVPIPPVADEEEPEGEEPEPEEQEEAERGIHSVLREQYAAVAINIKNMTANGSMMSMIWHPESQAAECFDVRKASKNMERTCVPLMKKAMVSRVLATYEKSHSSFDPDGNADIKSFLTMAPVHIVANSNQTLLNIKSLLGDADVYGWSLRKLLKEVRKLFTYDKARTLARDLLGESINASRVVIFEDKKKRKETA